MKNGKGISSRIIRKSIVSNLIEEKDSAREHARVLNHTVETQEKHYNKYNAITKAKKLIGSIVSKTGPSSSKTTNDMDMEFEEANGWCLFTELLLG